VLPARDGLWRDIAPGWADCVRLARAGLPFHVVAERRYDRSGDARRLAPALARGATVYLPQAHEALPRVARLMVAIRAEVLGPFRDECSFLFLVEGRGREGMGLHHDGPLDAFWLQIEGHRTVTVGPRVGARTPADMDGDLARQGGAGWRTVDLEPGTLFYLPPFTPHRVICRGRSLALSLTWSRPRRAGSSERARVSSLATWPVTSGRARAVPPASERLWTQVPAVLETGRAHGLRATHGDRGQSGPARLWTHAGRIDLPASARPLARALASMPSLPRSVRRGRHARTVETLLNHGVLDARDLPDAIVPANPAALDGWRFT
jgi:cupin superfamily protein